MSDGGAAEDDISGAERTPDPAASATPGEGGGARGADTAGPGREAVGARDPESGERDGDSAAPEQGRAGPRETGADGAVDGRGGVGSGGRFARLRRHKVLASAVASALVAGAVAVPLALGAWDDPCKELPAATRELAEQAPAAATRALDPRDDMSRYDAVTRLLPSGTLCGDGGRVLGQVLDAATGASDAGKPHSTAQSRVVYAIAASYQDTDVPPGAEPGVARVLAGYVADTTPFSFDDPEADTPAATGAQAAPDQAGWSRFGHFLAPGEAHPEFGFTHSGLLTATPARLFEDVARDPEAFAILYDAERAYLAHYLERLTAEGTDPDYHPEKEPGEDETAPTAGPERDLNDMARRVGTLMYARANGARDGRITDLGSFDAAVRRHTRGAYRAAPRQVTSRPPMSGIARRPASGAVPGDLMDGRRQLFLTVDAWAKARGVPAERASAIRQVLDDGYVQTYRYGPM
ncbi:hypothetical protein ABB07_33365 [Streptomyces incarnatus]|uniref:Uncharacterized protein n=1 Tax=Streptomyces incarnatus TaxID=665007 RepID=A0ABM5TUN1_9ACTN|nr:hypothetical protein [Streptomyces incarnatus]AKJ14775.1 hypothetical protein ABB07_33365 [Streptomyces incarnatus]